MLTWTYGTVPDQTVADPARPETRTLILKIVPARNGAMLELP
jgi:hypothetical protein